MTSCHYRTKSFPLSFVYRLGSVLMSCQVPTLFSVHAISPSQSFSSLLWIVVRLVTYLCLLPRIVMVLHFLTNTTINQKLKTLELGRPRLLIFTLDVIAEDANRLRVLNC